MKRICFVIILLMTTLTFLFPKAPIQTVNAANLSDSLVMNLTETHAENSIDINLRMVTNTGVSGMMLELVYNKNVFHLEGYEKGAALNSLEFEATNLSQDETLPVRFIWESDKIDTTKGIILKLHFSLKPDVEPGQYEIGFKCNKDLTYCINVSDNLGPEFIYKSAIIGKAVIDVEEEKITATEIVLENSAENAYLIVGIVASVIAISTIVTLYILKMIKKKRKRRREKWSEI